ncbi:MAG: hypothetical protein HFI37_03430 [Lachnospiraceae bacterium]|nr:hypothetical protein [Lachnospiraceae bacterium]
MLPGVYPSQKKDGTLYYRAHIHYKNKHISLGSYRSEKIAGDAYLEALELLNGNSPFDSFILLDFTLSFEKVVVLCNFRDNGIYIKTPIYLRNNYFSYYLNQTEELKFDIDDLFFYSQHKIIRRGGHLFVSEYGMQTSLYSRYGIRSHSVAGRDFTFANGDSTDWRYSNIIVINPYHGVTKTSKNGISCYKTKIHINGNYLIGTYPTAEIAAIAYNKAVDFAKASGIQKKFPENYLEEFSAEEYANLYTQIKISARYLEYLKTLS